MLEVQIGLVKLFEFPAMHLVHVKLLLDIVPVAHYGLVDGISVQVVVLLL